MGAAPAVPAGGPVTADGCPVALYARLPARDEPAIVHGAVPPGASILDLGCGTGRVAHPLIALGHDVVAVDQSPEMLAHITGAETVCAPIAGLDLGRRFGAVLLASHLLNAPDAADRRALLTAARRHLGAGARLIVEWHPPAWFDSVAAGAGATIGDVRVELVDVVRDGDLVSATARYRTDAQLWTHAFTARRLTGADLDRELRDAGLRFDEVLSDDGAWFAAGRAP